ncbi:MAG TPA: hypothetical protein VLC09_05700 [Polyangiaceae bacterium]|nr:hypothetical protein [Polyangiaceae bacterium]
MALPAHILERLPQDLRRNSLIRSASSLLPGQQQLDGQQLGQLRAGRLAERLAAGELLPGAVVEWVQESRGAGATSLALMACRRAQERGGAAAFVDPSRSLHAPALIGLGLDPSRLLVVEPRLEHLGRVAVRLAESRLFAVVVIDTSDTAGFSSDVSPTTSTAWARVVRRLVSSVENTSNTVVLLSGREQRSALPLPVQQRVELRRTAAGRLALRLTKNRGGGPEEPSSMIWPNFSRSGAHFRGGSERFGERRSEVGQCLEVGQRLEKELRSVEAHVA